MKRITTIIILTAITFCMNAQIVDTIYLDFNKEKSSLENHEFLRLIIREGLDDKSVEVKDFYKSGNIERHSIYIITKYNLKDFISIYENKKIIIDGPDSNWYENGQVRSINNYENGQRKGLPNFYTEKGEDLYFFVETMPQFIIKDYPSFLNYIYKNIQIPASNKTSGTVYLEIIINKNGNIETAKIVKGINTVIDKEIIRVALLSPQWIPGKKNGEIVNVKQTIPILIN